MHNGWLNGYNGLKCKFDHAGNLRWRIEVLCLKRAMYIRQLQICHGVKFTLVFEPFLFVSPKKKKKNLLIRFISIFGKLFIFYLLCFKLPLITAFEQFILNTNTHLFSLYFYKSIIFSSSHSLYPVSSMCASANLSNVLCDAECSWHCWSSYAIHHHHHHAAAASHRH